MALRNAVLPTIVLTMAGPSQMEVLAGDCRIEAPKRVLRDVRVVDAY
jgi:hypothetical protein